MVGMKELVDDLARKRGIPKSEAQSIIHDVVEVLSDNIVKYGGVAIKNVFTITQKTNKGRTGTFNDKEWKSEDSKTLSIRTGKDLKARLNR